MKSSGRKPLRGSAPWRKASQKAPYSAYQPGYWASNHSKSRSSSGSKRQNDSGQPAKARIACRWWMPLTMPLARALEHVRRDVEPELAELHDVGAVPVVAHPAVPLVQERLGVGAVLGEVLDHHRREDVDEGVVDPERLLQVALDQRRVVVVLQHGQQRGVAVGDVAGLVGLDRQIRGRQGEVAVAGGDVRRGHEHDVGERRLGHHLQRERALDRVADDEVRQHVEPGVGQHRAAERLGARGSSPPGRGRSWRTSGPATSACPVWRISSTNWTW